MRILGLTAALSVAALAGGAAAVWLAGHLIGRGLSAAFDIAGERE